MPVKEITDQDFTTTIESGVTMVDFWAPWCAPCRMVAPVLDELQTEMGDSASIVKLNVDDHPETAGEFGITSIPALLVFKDGKMVERHIGAGPKEHYKSMLNRHIQ